MNVNSNEFKALKKTVGFFALASIGATAFVYVSLFIPIQVIIWLLTIGFLVLGFWFMYEANLSRLNEQEKRNGK
jgi:putative Ca2+/H+ antiporter (TMEM165/GDT1 family)